MRNLFLNTFHYIRGGDCTYTFALADLLRKHGHEVFFFGMHHPLNQPCAQSKYFVDYIDFVEMDARKSLGNAFKVVGRSIYSWEARRRLHRLLEDLRPDVAHLQNIHAHLTPSILDELSRFGVPVVWTLHDYELICPDSHLLAHGKICEECQEGRFYRCVVNRCKKDSLAASFVAALEAYVHHFLRITNKVAVFISPSAFLKRKLMAFGWPEEKIRFMRNFLPHFPDERSVEEGEYALYLGQLVPWKGVRTLIKAMSRLPDVSLRIAGETGR